jgi:hypothetical protein
MEWYVGMSPTDRTRQEEALAEIKSIALNYPVDGVFLDFARWPLHWEIELRPGRGRPLDSTFDPATLAKFEEATGRFPEVSIRHQRELPGSGRIDSASGSNSNAGS